MHSLLLHYLKYNGTYNYRNLYNGHFISLIAKSAVYALPVNQIQFLVNQMSDGRQNDVNLMVSWVIQKIKIYPNGTDDNVWHDISLCKKQIESSLIT